ncbi:hypothetical protein Hypma_016349 [Hypsizygus marmoreus]|uniref:Association with the SNF1 complex (ASC) domain-containing protein n=1 Tax=Hypsizygus marmoreus TaxID=39966 RepID=A0A369J4V4_HYPMA|nr:hypothetical protein Hypma_016349 [Hypsizygus marmoreus]
MGNTSSNANSPRHSTIAPRPRQPSTSPTPGHPHPSLRTKKKSLELPDLASLSLSSSRGRQHSNPPKSASIPIPVHNHNLTAIPGEAGRTRAPITLPSTTDVLIADHTPPSTHQRLPYPPPSRAAAHTRSARIQELYNQSQAPSHPPPGPAPPPPFVQETVHSSIPIALGKAVRDTSNALHDGPPILVPVKITWRGGGKSVYLARAGDDDWKGRLLMDRESPTSAVYNATVALAPGTHHIRFLIDDQWRVADDLPTAVDDQGSLANYVAVPINYSPPNTTTTSIPPPKLKPGQSFWSAASSTDDESNDLPPLAPSSSKHPSQTQSQPQFQPQQPQQPGPQQPHQHQHHHHHSHHQPIWTNVLPPELIEAAREEEAYLAASAGQLDTSTRSTVVSGFVPAPNIPPAPGLPRHLDKLILNARIVTGGAGGAVGGSGSTKGAGGSGGGGGGPGGDGNGAGGRSGRDAGGRLGLGVNNNSVAGRSKGRERERERRERERDRDRDDRDRDRERRRDRRVPPPPPPPSEAGTVDGAVEVVVTTPGEDRPGATSNPTSPVQNVASESSSTPTPTASPTPAAYVPSSFLPPSTPTTTTNTSTPPTSTSTPAPTHPSTPLPLPTPALTPTLTPVPTPTLPPSTSRPLTLDPSPDANTPALTDDASVLPVPSHVVLHHLSTSAIRNGVLAVGNTTRYRKKYLTTIYYKPT